MPYELRHSGDGWKVFKKNSSKSFSKEPMPKSRAKAQMRALYANESFEQKLSNVLIEGLGFHKGSGHETITGYIPDVYAPDEPQVELEFDWQEPEPQTFDYPGSGGGVQITRVTRSDTGEEIDVDKIPPELYQHFEELAIDHLNKMHDRDLGAREDAADAKREEEMMRRADERMGRGRQF